ncbi:MAG: hypothetical protein GY699_03815 [Desulfobacteraceae bacterium]|nr:hypothetical protein [Desulfobacteraceae bacterium]
MNTVKRFKLKQCLIYAPTILLMLSASAWALAPIKIFPSESYGTTTQTTQEVGMTTVKRFKLKQCLIYILTILLILSASAWAQAPINIFPSESYGATNLKENKIKKIIKKNFSLDEAQVHKVNVKVIYEDSGDVDYLIVYILSSTTYGYETIRVDLTGNYSVTAIEENYQEFRE